MIYRRTKQFFKSKHLHFNLTSKNRYCFNFKIQANGRTGVTAQNIKFFIRNFFRKCDQIFRFLRMWSHLQKKSLRENVNFCAVNISLKAFKKWPNFQQNSKLLQILLPGRAIEIHLLFKSEGPMDIRHRISMALDPRKSNLGISNGCAFIFGSL